MSRRGIVLFALMSVIWGIPYLLIRVAVGEISPAMLVFLRTTIAALVLLPIALAGGGLLPTLRRWPWLATFAAVEIGLPWVLIGTAEQKVTSSFTALLIAGTPLVGTVIALLTGARADRLGRAGLAGLVLGTAGVGAIVGFNVGSADLLSLAEVGLVVVLYALGPVILNRRLADLPAPSVMGLSLALIALVYAPFGIAAWPSHLPSWPVLASVATLAVLCSAVAFLTFSALIAEVGPVRSTVITYINPAIAAILGVLVLNEKLTLGMGAGFVLVLAGSVLATRPSAVAPEPAAAILEEPEEEPEAVAAEA